MGQQRKSQEKISRNNGTYAHTLIVVETFVDFFEVLVSKICFFLVLGGPGGLKKAREAEIKKIHRISSKALWGMPSYDQKTRKVHDFLIHE